MKRKMRKILKELDEKIRKNDETLEKLKELEITILKLNQ